MEVRLDGLTFAFWLRTNCRNIGRISTNCGHPNCSARHCGIGGDSCHRRLVLGAAFQYHVTLCCPLSRDACDPLGD